MSKLFIPVNLKTYNTVFEFLFTCYLLVLEHALISFSLCF